MWYEMKIKTTTEAVEAINHMLYDYNASGIVIEDPNDQVYQDSYEGDWDYLDEGVKLFEFEGALIKAYIESDPVEIAEFAKDIHKRIKGLEAFGLDAGLGEVVYAEVNEADWANEWKKYYKPFHIAENLVICPVWETYDALPGEIVILMDPGKAFGTGTHETTSLCAEQIALYAKDAESLVDIGCGSGILAIIGATLGIENVMGIDIDPIAVEASVENASRNGLGDKITFLLGNLTEQLSGTYDIIAANIVADIIIMVTPDVKSLMHDQSVFIASGILVEKRDSVEKALMAEGMDILYVEERGEWCVIVSKRG